MKKKLKSAPEMHPLSVGTILAQGTITALELDSLCIGGSCIGVVRLHDFILDQIDDAEFEMMGNPYRHRDWIADAAADYIFTVTDDK